jgi:cellulose synthase (UDP-forming)
MSALPLSILILIPTSSNGQILFGVVGVALTCCLRPTSEFLFSRLMLLGTASVVVLRYWIWRITETIPDPSISLAFSLSGLLLLAETMTLISFFLNVFVSTDPTKSKAARLVPQDQLPSVDILVPTFDEKTDLLSVTLMAAKAIDYPADKRSIILCDDGGTEERCNSTRPEIATSAHKRRHELRTLCLELGVVYMTRARNENAKAGNLQAAFQRSTSELLAVFDADHVPSRDFLMRTVGFMVDDPRLSLVQTPHFFMNTDPVHRNLGLGANCPAESEMFYTDIHRGLDRWGGAFFCGSAALLRREALDSIGGFAGQTITEDAETALELHSKGWKSLFIDRAMVAGLQPETFASFIQQRGRWASGMIQLLILKNPLFRRGLTLPQRLCYLNSIFSWLFPFVRITYLIMPIFYLFFGIRFFVAIPFDAFINISAYIIMSQLVHLTIYARSRWPIISELYEIAQAPYLILAIVKTLARPHDAKFNVTAKDETLDADFLSPLHGPLTILLMLMVAGCAALIARWIAFPEDHGALSLVGGWAIFNLLLVSLAYRVVFEKRRQKNPVDFGMRFKATMTRVDQDKSILPVSIISASVYGATLAYQPSTSMSEVMAVRALQGAEVILSIKFADAPRWTAPLRARLISSNSTSLDARLTLVFSAGQQSRVRNTIAMIYGDGDTWRAIRANTLHPKSISRGVSFAFGLVISAIPTLLIDVWRCMANPAVNHPTVDHEIRCSKSVHASVESIYRTRAPNPDVRVSTKRVS